MSIASKILIALALVIAAPSIAAVDARCVEGCGGDLLCRQFRIDDDPIVDGDCVLPHISGATADACTNVVYMYPLPDDMDFHPISLSGKVLGGNINAADEDCQAVFQVAQRDDTTFTSTCGDVLPMGAKAEAILGSDIMTLNGEQDTARLNSCSPISGGMIGVSLTAYAGDGTSVCTALKAARFHICGRLVPNGR